MEIVKEDITPVCPHCGKKIEGSRGFFSVNRVFCCPHCHKIVGISSGQ